MIVDHTEAQPDSGLSADYMDEVHFSSARQNTLFEIWHVMRHLDPALAQTLVSSYDQLAAAIRRYPNGMETMNEEAQAESQRSKAEGANGEGGHVFGGNPEDLGSQHRLMDAARTGNFTPSLDDALTDTGKTPRRLPRTTHLRHTGRRQPLFARSSIAPESA